MKEKYLYRTSDLNLASFLVAKGLIYLYLERVSETRSNFVLEIPEEINMINIQKEWFSSLGEFYRLLFKEKKNLTRAFLKK